MLFQNFDFFKTMISKCKENIMPKINLRTLSNKLAIFGLIFTKFQMYNTVLPFFILMFGFLRGQPTHVLENQNTSKTKQKSI